MGEVLTTISDIGISGFVALALILGFMLFVSWAGSQGGDGDLIEAPAPVHSRDRS